MEESFFGHIVRFINQAQTRDLTARSYPQKCDDLDVKFGFGKGNVAQVPWIAFLGFSQKVTNGIYPVYLYYKEASLLLLAYGVSATNEPKRSWGFKDSPVQTIKDFFKTRNVTIPNKYLDSFVFESYPIDLNKENNGLKKEMLEDLMQTLDFFRHLFGNEPSNEKDEELKPINDPEKPDRSILQKFVVDAKTANFRLSKELASRFIASLATKPFVILTGLSGSGKTKLAQVFAQWICKSQNQYRLIPVGPDWTNREPLLGYPNALDSSMYVSPDSGVLEMICDAIENTQIPYFLILDEMNMSHVERYFADFLSAMESEEDIPLYSQALSITGTPPSIKLPKNLFIIGTVNIDETTYMFSPKVLDRANVIEFRVTQEDMSEFLKAPTLKINMPSKKGVPYANEFISLGEITKIGENRFSAVLLDFFKELKKIGAEYGYRTAMEINKFCILMEAIDPSETRDNIIDYVILQKLLPKVHGSRRKLEPVLKTMVSLCLKEQDHKEDIINGKQALNMIKKDIRYPLSLEKILRMFRGMIDNGFTSFTEA